MNPADCQELLFWRDSDPKQGMRVNLDTCMITDPDPCRKCEYMRGCKSSCKAFRDYTNTGRFRPGDRCVNPMKL